MENAECKMNSRKPKSASAPTAPLQSAICNLKPEISSSAFTLTELLVVITIIVIFVTLALPAFNLINGSRSIAAGTNEVSAFLGRARMEAIGLQQTRGVAFYVDATTTKSTMAIVQQPIQLGQAVVYSGAAANYTADTYVTNGSQYFVATHDLNSPIPPLPTGTSPLDDGNWSQVDPYVVDSTPDSDSFALPFGVGAQLLNDYNVNNGTAASIPSNHYVSFGVVLFSASGNLISQRVSFGHGNTLGKRTNVSANLPFFRSTAGANNTIVLSQVGVVLFDLASYGGVGGSMAPQSIFANPLPTAIPTTEATQETWLNQNATPLLINRYNGTLVKAE